MGSAYLHEGDRTVTAVFVNDSQEDRRISVSLQGLDVEGGLTCMHAYVTSEEHDLAQAEEIKASGDGKLEGIIPARSVVTWCGQWR
jgi:hypothetical protein